MKVGTKSVLFGAHQFLIHPLFVALAWWKLFGFPWDLRLWVAFFVHDLGYWGKPNIDGPEGKMHVLLGARIMHRLFDRECSYQWMAFCLNHSRHWAKRHGQPVSPLGFADKLVTLLEPWWLYLPRVILSGEIHEFMSDTHGKLGPEDPNWTPWQQKRVWFDRVSHHLAMWVADHCIAEGNK